MNFKNCMLAAMLLFMALPHAHASLATQQKIFALVSVANDKQGLVVSYDVPAGLAALPLVQDKVHGVHQWEFEDDALTFVNNTVTCKPSRCSVLPSVIAARTRSKSVSSKRLYPAFQALGGERLD
jgi:hypothetical protein